MSRRAALPLFWQHLLTVLSGSLAAQALPILAAPLVTRLCTPAELGGFSVWFGVVAVVAVGATLRLENAMIVDHARHRQRLCFDVVGWSAGWLAVLVTAVLVLARAVGLLPMSWPAVLTLGAAAWLTAVMQTTLAYAASHNAFAPAAKARVVAAGVTACAQVALLALLTLAAASAPAGTDAITNAATNAVTNTGAGATALLGGQLLGLAIGLAAARRWLGLPLAPALRSITPDVGAPLQSIPPQRHSLQSAGLDADPGVGIVAGGRRQRRGAEHPRWMLWLTSRGRRLARRGPGALWPTVAQRRYLYRHRALWHFTLPSNLLNAAVGQLPLLFIGIRHGVVAAGLFALTLRVISAPISLLAASVLEVFKRESVRQYQADGNCRPAYLHALRVLVALGLAPALVLLFASPALFAFAFGDAWRGAGELAQIMAPLFFLNFVASPLSYVFFVAGRQKIELVWQVALAVLTVAAFAAPWTLAHNVLAYTIGYSLLYLVYLQLSYRYARNRPQGRRIHAAS